MHHMTPTMPMCNFTWTFVVTTLDSLSIVLFLWS